MERSGVKRKTVVAPQQAYLESIDADIYILTECHGSFRLRHCPHSATSAPGQLPYAEEDRAVGIWSRWPLVRTVPTADPRLSVCAELETPAGPALIYGSLLPYHADGAPRMARWESHRQAVTVQTEEWRRLRQEFPDHLMCVAGDFNMNLDGRKWYGDEASRQAVLSGLAAAGMRCVTTEDWHAQVYRSSIDHICVSGNLVLTAARAWPGTSEAGRRLSDHNGVLVEVQPADAPREDKLGPLVEHFHELIRSRVLHLFDGIPPSSLPDQRAVVSASQQTPGWFPVAGFCGGFSYYLVEAPPASPRLRVTSWCRIVAGSEQEHDVTPDGVVLVSEGDDPGRYSHPKARGTRTMDRQ